MSNSNQQKGKIITRSIAKERKSKLLCNSLNSAIKFGRIETVKLLVKTGANINEPRRNKFSPLHVAAKHGCYIIMKFLIENGAFLDYTLVGPKNHRFTPLHLAVLGNHVKCVELLLERGASVSPKSGSVCHPIHFAAFKNNVEIATLLLDYGADVNCRFYNSFFEELECTMHRSLWLDHTLPLLHYSILKKFDEMTDLLLNRGADVNLKTSLEKTTLMQAVEVHNIDLVKFLVEKRNANVNDRDVFEQPVLHFTIVNGKRKVSMDSEKIDTCFRKKYKLINFLVEKGAGINARFPANKEKSSIINYMIKYGYSLVVYFLLHDGDLNFNEIDLTPIYSGQHLNQAITPDIVNDFGNAAVFRIHLEVIIIYIVAKAISLQMIGLLVDENILKNPFNGWYEMEWYTDKINWVKDQIMTEINYTKETKINDGNITVWRLLTCEMKDLVILMSSEKFQNFKMDQYCKRSKMNYYYSMLEKRISYAENRTILLSKSTEFISNLFINHLPYDCCKKIVNYCDNQELTFN